MLRADTNDQLTHEKVFCRSTYGNCLRAAIVNRLNYFGYHNGEMRVLESSEYAEG